MDSSRSPGGPDQTEPRPAGAPGTGAYPVAPGYPGYPGYRLPPSADPAAPAYGGDPMMPGAQPPPTLQRVEPGAPEARWLAQPSGLGPWAGGPIEVGYPATRQKPTGKGGRLVNGLLGLAVVIAIGGVAFAAGRMSAPATSTPTVGQGLPGGGTGQDTGALPGASSAPGAFTGGGGTRGLAGGSITVQGTITAITDGSISLATASGATIEIPTDATTTYHDQTAASRADLAVGVMVRVELAGGFGGGRQGGSTAPGASIAPGASPAPGAGGPLPSRGPGGFGAGGGALGTAKDVEVVTASGQ